LYKLNRNSNNEARRESKYMAFKKKAKKNSLEGIDKKLLKQFANVAKKSKTVTSFKAR
jgi:hypothetical protein